MKQVLSFCAVLCLLAAVSHAATLVDDFDSYEAGQVEAVTDGKWVAVTAGYANSVIAVDALDAANKLLSVTGQTNEGRGAVSVLPAEAQIPNGETKTLFFRFRATTSTDHSIGLSHQEAPTWFSGFCVQITVIGGNLGIRDGGSVRVLHAFDTGAEQPMYNVWAVVNNADNSIKLYLHQDGDAGATEANRLAAGAVNTFGYRNDNAGNTEPLRSLFFFSYNAPNGTVWVDDIYVTEGEDLSNPAMQLFRAHDPYPANGQDGIELGDTLSWSTGLDPEDLETVNPDITHHYVYLKHTDANFIDLGTTFVSIEADGPTGLFTPASGLLPDMTYYWRVDEILNNNPADPNNVITGPVWRFKTILSAPIVTVDPAAALVVEGEDAEFVVSYTSYSEATARWFISVEEGEDIPLTDEEGTVLNAAKYAVENNKHTQAKLTVKDAEVADEGYYYCVLINPDELEDQSDPAALAIKRLRAHWTLNGLVGGKYADETGNYPADPNGTPQFIDGANPVVTGQAVVIDQVNGFASAGTWNPSEYSNQFTISLWAKWAGQTNPTTWQGLISKEVSYGAGTMMWQYEINQGAPYAVVLKNGLETGNLTTPVLPIDAWEHVVITWSGTTATIYRNGVQAASGAWQPGSMTDAPINIGISAFSPTIDLMFNGALDDIRIYNYVFDKYAAADLFHDVTGLGVCIEPDNYVAAYDFNGNCKIDLGDFAMMAAEWLKCGRYPVESCED